MAYMEEIIETLLHRAFRMPTDDAKALVRSLRITLLGIETDAQEALGPFRTEQSCRDVRAGLKTAMTSVNQLLDLLSAEVEKPERSQNGNAQVGVPGA